MDKPHVTLRSPRLGDHAGSRSHGDLAEASTLRDYALVESCDCQPGESLATQTERGVLAKGVLRPVDSVGPAIVVGDRIYRRQSGSKGLSSLCGGLAVVQCLPSAGLSGAGGLRRRHFHQSRPSRKSFPLLFSRLLTRSPALRPPLSHTLTGRNKMTRADKQPMRCGKIFTGYSRPAPAHLAENGSRCVSQSQAVRATS